jgi:hypothetical protein
LAHHYLRLIVDDHSYSGPGLSGWVACSRRVRLSRRLGILWLIVDDHDCIYWLYLYGPDLLYLYYTLHPTTTVAISRPVWTPEQASCFKTNLNLMYMHVVPYKTYNFTL